MKKHSSLHLSAALATLLFVAEQLVPAATITVTNANDTGTGSLRNAIASTSPGDIIVFDVTGTITLTSGRITIAHDLTISGPGFSGLILRTNGDWGVFIVSGGTVSISGMTMQGNGRGARYYPLVHNTATLTLTDCLLTSNQVNINPSAIQNNGTLVIASCTIANNRSDNGPGGIGNYAGHLTMRQCAVTNNSSGSQGGGIENRAVAVIENTTIAGNEASYGGGISNNGWAASVPELTISMTNCTVANNRAYGGDSVTAAGIENFTTAVNATISLANCTVANNQDPIGIGGIFSHRFYNDHPSVRATVILKNTIVGPHDQPNFKEEPTSLGNNISSDSSASLTDPTDRTNTDPKLGPLWDYGGLTKTFMLLPDSPAINAGGVGEAVPVTDQRGVAREGDPDIGAFEFQAVPTAVTVTTDRPGYTRGRIATLTAWCEGTGLSYQWYAGASGDTASPIPGATDRICLRGPLEWDENCWVRVGYPGGCVDSPTALLDVNPAIHVSHSGNDSNDGTSWSTAVRSLTEALARAVPGDDIWVAEGTYKPNDSSGSPSRSQWFWLVDEVGVYGGFAGTESDWRDRSLAGHPTILSGDLQDNDADLDDNGFVDVSTMADNCYHVFYLPYQLELTAAAVLDGVIVRGGNADGSGNDYQGGTMKSDRGSPSIVNCTVANNNGGLGGAFFFSKHRGSIKNCTIAKNTASIGAGVYLSQDSTATILNTTMTYNSASSYGGALCASSSGSSITNCILWENLPATQIFFYPSCAVSAAHCVIQNGYAGGTAILTSDPLLQSFDFHGGSTETMPISAGSSAIDAGATASGIPNTDQRGFARSSPPDIGACEFQPSSYVGTAPTSPSTIGSALTAQIQTDHASPAYQWYLGAVGDTSRPIPGAAGATLSYGPLEQGVRVWVRVTPGGGETPVDSLAWTVEVRGTYDQWCDFHGLEGAERDPGASPAGDRIGNLVKFALALDPLIPSSLGSRCDFEYDPGSRMLKQTWVLSKTPLDLVTGGQWSQDLQGWSSAGITDTTLESNAATQTRQVSFQVNEEPRCFMRLHVGMTP